MTTQTNILHSNDILNNETKIINNNDELFDTLVTDTDNDSNKGDTAAASKAENDDSVSALLGDTAFFDLMREAKLQCFPTLEAVNLLLKHIKLGQGTSCASIGPSKTDFVCMNAMSM